MQKNKNIEKTKNTKEKNIPKKKMTVQEIEDWDNLYEYVRTNIFEYDSNQSLSTNVVMRLKGLLKGKYFENNSTKDMANYSYKVILTTFKYCSPDIKKALRNNSFKDEQHKTNYIFKVVESNINTVYLKMKNAKINKENTKTINVNVDFIDDANKIVPKEKKNHKNRYDNLW